MTFEEWYAINLMMPHGIQADTKTLTYKAMKRAYEAGYEEGHCKGYSKGLKDIPL